MVVLHKQCKCNVGHECYISSSTICIYFLSQDAQLYITVVSTDSYKYTKKYVVVTRSVKTPDKYILCVMNMNFGGQRQLTINFLFVKVNLTYSSTFMSSLLNS